MNRGGARHLNVHAAVFTPASVIETNDFTTPAIPASHAKLSPTAAAFVPHLQYRVMSDLIDKLPPALKPRDPDISSLLELEVLGTLHDEDIYLLRDAGSILFCEGDRPQQFYGLDACLVPNHRQGSRYTLWTNGIMLSKELLLSLGRDTISGSYTEGGRMGSAGWSFHGRGNNEEHLLPHLSIVVNVERTTSPQKYSATEAAAQDNNDVKIERGAENAEWTFGVEWNARNSGFG
ncbi:hypothetical protein BZA77DRAFT_358750 [Pyronema omphalodes]|nr:hypothetical protein BZA77DRAFT_358750 [Pyronema omphalodes]